MAVFEASDIMEIAVRIEENGANFYRYAVQVAGNEAAKALFEHLAEEEVAHRKLFTEMLAGMEPTAPVEGYDGEYAAYLHDYVDNRLVFTEEGLAGELARIQDEVYALNFAIQRELDSIQYYREIRDLLPADRRESVDRIIQEEKRHVVKLSEMKKRLAS